MAVLVVPFVVPAVIIVTVFVVPPVLIAILAIVVFLPVVLLTPGFIAWRSPAIILLIVPPVPALRSPGGSLMTPIIAVMRGVAGIPIGASLLEVIIVAGIVVVPLQLVIAVCVVVLQSPVASPAVLHLQYAVEVGFLVHSKMS